MLFFVTLSQAKSPPPGTGKADVKANILIMLDTSGSMGAQTNTSSRLYYPYDAAVDSKGNVFIVDIMWKNSNL